MGNYLSYFTNCSYSQQNLYDYIHNTNVTNGDSNHTNMVEGNNSNSNVIENNLDSEMFNKLPNIIIYIYILILTILNLKNYI